VDSVGRKRTNVEGKNISDQTRPKIQRMHDCFDLQVVEAVHEAPKRPRTDILEKKEFNRWQKSFKGGWSYFLLCRNG
jgi:hypothetical protein